MLAVVDPGRRHRSPGRRDRGRRRRGRVGRSRQRAAGAGGGDGGRRRARRRAHQPRVPPRRAGRHVRRPRRVRAGRRPPLQRRRPGRARRRGRPGAAAARMVPLPREDGDGRGRGAVGRPLRQLPAQRRSRGPASTWAATSQLRVRSATDPSRRRRAPAWSGVRASPTSAAARRARARLLRDAGHLPRPALGGRGARPRARATRCVLAAPATSTPSGDRPCPSVAAARPPGSLAAVRPATTLTLALLLVAILVAGVVSLFASERRRFIAAARPTRRDHAGRGGNGRAA